MRGKQSYHKLIIASVVTSLLVSGITFAQGTPSERRAPTRSGEALGAIQELRSQNQEKAKEMKEKIQAKMSQIKDVDKKDAARKISDKFDQINEIWTDHFTNVLDKLDALLVKIKSRRDKAASNGNDVSLVDGAIRETESNIAIARTDVANQALRLYLIDVSSMSSNTDQDTLLSQFREKFKILRDQLFTDLTVLRDGPMQEARSSMQDALQSLTEVPNIDQESATNK